MNVLGDYEFGLLKVSLSMKNLKNRRKVKKRFK